MKQAFCETGCHQCIKLIKIPLTNIYNASLKSGIFPNELKIAKGDVTNVQIYRPIALLSVCSKLLEKLMYNRLTAFIEGNRVLTEAHHGFRTWKSTETVLQIFIISVQEAIEKKMNSSLIFLDLTKAYNILNHRVLLSKLDSYGIRSMDNLWFEFYLSHWKQCAEINSRKQGTYV
jgi:hypothetical protein